MAPLALGSSFAFVGAVITPCVDRASCTSSRWIGHAPRTQLKTGADGKSGRSGVGFYHVKSIWWHLRDATI